MFAVNKLLLQVIKHRSDYDALRGTIPMAALDKQTKDFIAVLDSYFREYTDHKVIDPDAFMFTATVAIKDAESVETLGPMVETVMDEPDDGSRRGLIRQLKTLEFANELDQKNNAYHVGEDIDLFDAVAELVDHFEGDIQRDPETSYIQEDIEDIIKGDVGGIPLRWRVKALTGSMPGLKTGMQIIFAARPGKGKTSFMAYNATYMAKQLPSDRPVVWFNNEGKGTEIFNTVYRAALSMGNDQIRDLGFSNARQAYESFVEGAEKVRIFDIHGRDYRFMERLIKTHTPGVVIFDMLDNVKGFGDAARTDLRLEQLYQWARECAVTYDFLSLPTSQLSADGEGVMWPDQSMLKDSKTAKQGACSGLITMGAVNKPDKLNSRYLYIPKAFKGEPAPGFRSDCLTEVLFITERAQFKE
jgi:replicative DNA helicase